MATEIIRPTSAVSAVWSISTVSAINQVITQPTSGDRTTARKNGTGSQAQQWNLNTPVATGTITSALVWVEAACDTADGDGVIDNIRINLNGTWYSYGGGSNTLTVGTYQWLSFNFSGSYGSMATSAPILEIVGSGAGGSSSRLYIDTAYVDLTYTPGGGGGSTINPASMVRL